MKEKKFKMRHEPIRPIRIMEMEECIPEELWLGVTTEGLARKWPGGIFRESCEGDIEFVVIKPEPLEEYGKRLEMYFTEKASYDNWRKINSAIINEMEHKQRLDKIAQIKKNLKELEEKQRKTNQETIHQILQKKKELEKLEELQLKEMKEIALENTKRG